MAQLPSLEVLQAAHTFPCVFTIKAIGKAEGGFAARAVAAVRDEIGGEADPPFRLSETSGGRHVSVSLDITMASAEQVIGVYRCLQVLEGLVLLL